VSSLLAKINTKKKDKHYKSNLLSFEELYGLLSLEEKHLVEELLGVKPDDFEVRYPYLGVSNVPKDVVAITKQKVKNQQGEVELGNKYLPQRVFDAYDQLNKQHIADTGKPILIGSGYRSPAYQAVLFLAYLREDDYEFKKTISYVAVPGYSQHGHPDKTAIDFKTVTGIPHEEPWQDFDKTPEFEWLNKNAASFGFSLSYPKGNKWNVVYEPWHWQFVGYK